jgi:hypothetical protein
MNYIYLFVILTLLSLVIFFLYSIYLQCPIEYMEYKGCVGSIGCGRTLESKMLITRHLQRIDGKDIYDTEKTEWVDIYRKIPGFIENPYISAKNGANIVVSKLVNYIPINIIITSPFLRCMETAIIYARRMNVDLKKIYIDYNLGEWNSDHIYQKPFNSDFIFNHSIKFLTNQNLLNSNMKECYINNRDELGGSINDSYKGDQFEDLNTYTNRVEKEIVRLGHSIKNSDISLTALIVTHSCSTKGLTKSVNPGYSMKYEDLVDISQYIF